ncbi:hypothetical protein HZB58_01370 [Candidatus Gottesmanbacteria bacterium]|nr:hypothetical protein [Candidatus Gottesmanbacteria bacterium]
MNASAHSPRKDEEVYASWSSPSRLFKKRDREFFVNIGAIVFLLSVILVFVREFVLIATVLSIVFLIYVLSTVPPEEIDHRITNLGIESGGHFYRWEECADFWFEEQWGQHMLVLRLFMAPRVIILLADQPRDKIRERVAQHIPFREQPDRTWVDNAARWITEKIPLEKPQA